MPASERAATAWVNTVSRSHVLRGVAGGFTQANRGVSEIDDHDIEALRDAMGAGDG